MVGTTNNLKRKWNDFLTSLTLLRSSSFSALSFTKSSPCVLLSVELSSFSVLACLVKEPRLLLCLCNSSVVFFSSLICLSSSCFSHLQQIIKLIIPIERLCGLPGGKQTSLTATETLLNVISQMSFFEELMFNLPLRHTIFWDHKLIRPNVTSSFYQDFSKSRGSGTYHKVYFEMTILCPDDQGSCFISI